jgi:hypothetical protein
MRETARKPHPGQEYHQPNPDAGKPLNHDLVYRVNMVLNGSLGGKLAVSM